MAKTLYCPECGSDKLVAVGEPSALDGKRARQCTSCDAMLAPPRSRWLLGLIFAFGVAVTGFSVALKWSLMQDFGQPIYGQPHLFLGILLGPVVGYLAGRALFQRMPVAKPPQGESGHEESAN